MFLLIIVDTHREEVVLNSIPYFCLSLKAPILTFLQEMGQYTSYAVGCWMGLEAKVFLGGEMIVKG